MMNRKRSLRLILVLQIYSCVTLTAHGKNNPGLKFIENKNQWRNEVIFRSDVSGGSVSLWKDRFRFCFIEQKNTSFSKGHQHYDLSNTKYYEDGTVDHSPTTKVHIYDVTFRGANPDVFITGEEELVTRYNYFLGNDRAAWGSGARSFANVKYKEAYCGVDLSVYSDKGRMKYEWIVSPQSDPSQIQLVYNGVNNVNIDNGNLHIQTSINEVWEYKPYAYQWKDGNKITVPCEYNLNENILTYNFPEGYDACYELVIDPILIFSAYSGSTLDNWGNTATYDSHGNVYSGGMVKNPENAEGFPKTPGAFQTDSTGGTWDVGILKFDSAGSQLLYATYIGGRGVETPQSLVVNSKNELLILGITSSPNFPVLNNNSTFQGGTSIDPLGDVECNGGTDIFVFKLSEDGSTALGGRYLGGSENDGVNFIDGFINTTIKTESPLAKNYGDQLRGDIIADENDTVYIASNTLSENFSGAINNLRSSSHDAVVVKLSPDLSKIKWAKYIGGSGTDAAYSIKLKDKVVYLGGGTTSTNFPGINGFKQSNSGGVDGWITSLSSITSQIINATYLGTSKYDQAYFIDLNAAGEIFTFGQTQGNYPVQGNVYVNENAGQFIHKLSNDLKISLFSTTIGSGGNTPNISPTAFLVSNCNTLYLSGWGGAINETVLELNDGTIINRNYVGGNTLNLPITSNAYQKQTVQGNDFYLMVLSADASQFLYGTYLGGSTSATHVDGGTSRFDKKGIVYHAVCAGCGGESDFPADNAPAGHQTNNSTNCNNAVFKFDLSLLKAKMQTNSVKLDMPGFNKICIPDKIVFENKSIGGETYEWDFGDGTRITMLDNSSITHQYQASGQYTVKLRAVDEGTCIGKDSTFAVVSVYNIQTEIQDDDDLCKGDPYQLKSSGAAIFEWTTNNFSFASYDRENFHIVNPLDTTIYYVKIYELNGCVRWDTVQLDVIPTPEMDFKFKLISDCFSRPKVNLTNITDPKTYDQAVFDFGDGETSDADDILHEYASNNVFNIKLTGSRAYCVNEKTLSVPIYTIKVPNVITPGQKDKNDTFTIQFGDVEGVTPGNFGIKISLAIYNRWGRPVYESDDYKYDWSGEGLAAGIYFYEVTIEGYSTCKSWLHVIK